MAEKDPITGLSWSTEIAGDADGHSTGIITVDIDGFGQFADKHGQEKAEEVLQHVVAGLVKAGLSPEQIYRVPENSGIRGLRFANCMHADEFIILVEDPAPGEIDRLANLLNPTLARNPYTIKYRDISWDESFTLSVGALDGKSGADSVGVLIDKCWDACLIAKMNGKGKAVEWHPDLRTQQTFSLRMETFYKLRSFATDNDVSIDSLVEKAIGESVNSGIR